MAMGRQLETGAYMAKTKPSHRPPSTARPTRSHNVSKYSKLEALTNVLNHENLVQVASVYQLTEVARMVKEDNDVLKAMICKVEASRPAAPAPSCRPFDSLEVRAAQRVAAAKNLAAVARAAHRRARSSPLRCAACVASPRVGVRPRKMRKGA
ncbi:hypothetical protein EDC01DRAFT_776843 [Geopyxis carbonaria]|nr:hypothetical protein EDC01DRAFT_776843 [Geopyxis carbonaria]